MATSASSSSSSINPTYHPKLTQEEASFLKAAFDGRYRDIEQIILSSGKKIVETRGKLKHFFNGLEIISKGNAIHQVILGNNFRAMCQSTHSNSVATEDSEIRERNMCQIVQLLHHNGCNLHTISHGQSPLDLATQGHFLELTKTLTELEAILAAEEELPIEEQEIVKKTDSLDSDFKEEFNEIQFIRLLLTGTCDEVLKILSTHKIDMTKKIQIEEEITTYHEILVLDLPSSIVTTFLKLGLQPDFRMEIKKEDNAVGIEIFWHLFAIWGNEEVIEECIRCNINPYDQDQKGLTIFHFLSINEHPEMNLWLKMAQIQLQTILETIRRTDRIKNYFTHMKKEIEEFDQFSAQPNYRQIIQERFSYLLNSSVFLYSNENQLNQMIISFREIHLILKTLNSINSLLEGGNSKQKKVLTLLREHAKNFQTSRVSET